MAKILKNTTGSNITISDTGVTILASPGFYTIPSTDFALWAASTDVLKPLADGDLLFNDGSNDYDGTGGFDVSAAVDLIKDLQHKSVDTAAGGLVDVLTDPFGKKRLALDILQTGDHGDLSGLGDDDHTQYLTETRHDALPSDNPHSVSLEQARTVDNSLSGPIDMGGNKITDLALPVAGTDAASKDFVVSLINGLDWQDSVLDKDLSTPPGSPTTGDRYIVGPSATGAWAGQDDKITEWNGTSWDFFIPNEGFATWVEDEDVVYVYNGTSWIKFGNIITHANLLGLANDDHTQYHTDARGDVRYFKKTEHLDSSAGASDSGKPIKLDSAGQVANNMIRDASEAVKGKAEIATQAETDAGTDDTRIVTPLKLKTTTSIPHANTSGQTADDHHNKNHGLAGSEHISATLAQLNAKISDATLDDSSSSRPPNGAAGGDLSGTYPSPTVAKIKGKAADTFTTKGDIYVYNGTSIKRLPVGTNGQRIEADSAQALGVKWITPTAMNSASHSMEITPGNTGGGSAPHFSVSNASYLTLAHTIFLGTTKVGTLTDMVVSLEADGGGEIGNKVDIKIVDSTNSQTLAELLDYVLTGSPVVVSLGTLSNLPTGQATIQLQARKSIVDGGKGMLFGFKDVL